LRGIVKWFSQDRGYGFITTVENGRAGEDIFAHFTDIEGDGFRNLYKDEQVEFEIVQDVNNKVKAVNIKQGVTSSE